ncbi:MAG: hypothetical protein E6706_05900 [Anaerococcus hydrogenalis]|nr:hypothetical protein [Anaerococcus hydrogenalis]MDU3199576.1 hypothetical protein [Anaerococcus hydrogenalis]
MKKLNELWKSSKIFKILIIVLGLAIIGSIFGSNDEFKNEEKQVNEDNYKSKDKYSNNEKDKLDKIYDKDETINKFLNRYNEIYPDKKIESKDVQMLHHHGKDHSNQVRILYNDLEITLSNVASEFSVLLNSGNNDLQKDINYEFKDAFTKTIKTFNSEVSDDKIEKYWKDLLKTNYFEGDNISGNSMRGIDEDHIGYINIEGKFK